MQHGEDLRIKCKIPGVKLAFGEKREKGEKTRVGYIQGDAGLESETRESRRRNSVARITGAGITDAGFASRRCHKRGDSRRGERADSESTNPDPRQNNHIKNS